ncbi:type I-C CRISPR-associated protein Cas5c [Pseudorhodoferax sp. Leaf267]|uniref:type I-C CRISPR-associated protein Cas5c n=1 Tax=Pseudorhodoferax sp. Leaf267 TaxID=1736316 RepID=UPI000700C996|nr:type I-C CRISPR-associated protein Cas5c [Pseudorhodoferax sp. Leaf267]KQP21729.1 type I-C CRISPR-associated protein Cas5 [Pseudorhodoferax sp. Leaf267]
MPDQSRNSIEFSLRGRHALFTDPLTKVGGEKCSYHVPTYEALKGAAKSIYWKPTLVWVIDQVRVMRRIRTQTKGTKPLEFSGGNTLAIYTFLHDVDYQVRAHFEWNLHRPELAADRIEGKHHEIARRMLARGGRQDIFLGTRDCQGYAEPCVFGEGPSELDEDGELALGLMFHGFDYPDEAGGDALHARFWRPTMVNGVIRFPRPEDCAQRRFVRKMTVKRFGVGNLCDVSDELARSGDAV